MTTHEHLPVYLPSPGRRPRTQDFDYKELVADANFHAVVEEHRRIGTFHGICEGTSAYNSKLKDIAILYVRAIDEERAALFRNQGITYARGYNAYREAISCYNRALELSNHSSSRHVTLANRAAAYIKTQKYADALEDAQDAVKLCPDYAIAHSVGGYCLSRLGLVRQAVVEYSIALLLNPADSCSEALLAEAKQTLTASGESPEEIAALEAQATRIVQDYDNTSPLRASPERAGHGRDARREMTLPELVETALECEEHHLLSADMLLTPVATRHAGGGGEGVHERRRRSRRKSFGRSGALASLTQLPHTLKKALATTTARGRTSSLTVDPALHELKPSCDAPVIDATKVAFVEPILAARPRPQETPSVQQRPSIDLTAQATGASTARDRDPESRHREQHEANAASSPTPKAGTLTPEKATPGVCSAQALANSAADVAICPGNTHCSTERPKALFDSPAEDSPELGRSTVPSNAGIISKKTLPNTPDATPPRKSPGSLQREKVSTRRTLRIASESSCSGQVPCFEARWPQMSADAPTSRLQCGDVQKSCRQRQRDRLGSLEASDRLHPTELDGGPETSAVRMTRADVVEWLEMRPHRKVGWTSSESGDSHGSGQTRSQEAETCKTGNGRSTKIDLDEMKGNGKGESETVRNARPDKVSEKPQASSAQEGVSGSSREAYVRTHSRGSVRKAIEDIERNVQHLALDAYRRGGYIHGTLSPSQSRQHVRTHNASGGPHHH